MSTVKIIKGDLFNAPKGSIICHAVNCKGVWGAGIAKQFATEYPSAYKFYKRMCEENGASLLGSCLLVDVDDYKIACLFTSNGYGPQVDDEEDILYNTQSAIDDLIWQNIANLPINMCKINSGLFCVPWKKTQDVLEEFDAVEFTVYEY
jgi:ADP-ribose 1''-phosphate phosphatase